LDLRTIIIFIITVIFIYLVFINIVLYIYDYISERKKILFYINSMKINNFYRKYLFTNSFLKEVICNKMFTSDNKNYIFLSRFIFAAIKYSKLLEKIKTYHIKTSYLKFEKVYTIRCFLVLNPVSCKNFEKNLVIFKQEFYNITKFNTNAIIFNVDVLE